MLDQSKTDASERLGSELRKDAQKKKPYGKQGGGRENVLSHDTWYCTWIS